MSAALRICLAGALACSAARHPGAREQLPPPRYERDTREPLRATPEPDSTRGDAQIARDVRGAWA